MMKNVAIVLAGGSGSRMKSGIKKQYLQLGGKPVLWYSLKAFEDCSRIHEIILVCGRGEAEYCREEFVDRLGITKIGRIVEGGRERYLSVYEGLKAIRECDYVMIHDGARPFIEEEMLVRILNELPGYGACVLGMPVKDTIKTRDENGCVEQTLPREKLWMIQTPQSFEYKLIREAYDELLKADHASMKITDDAMVAEYILKIPVKLIEGSYENIKITTPEDIILAEAIAKARRQTAEPG